MLLCSPLFYLCGTVLLILNECFHDTVWSRDLSPSQHCSVLSEGVASFTGHDSDSVTMRGDIVQK